MEPDTEKLEFFLKLGYSREGVIRVLTKLGQGALVNDILQELIQMGGRPHIEDNYEENLVPKLVARGSGGTMDLSRRLLGSDPEDPDNYLRPIVIDGSNVAMSHGNKETFSCRGIRLAVDWFRERGHNYIKVFVPSWRKEPPRSDSPISEQHILEDLEKQAVLVYTPSRKVNGKRVVCYDDRYIVKVAYEKDGIIVSNDNYRDLQSENPEWKWFIEQRLLMFSFVNDKFMPPDDPLGRHGPTLSNFLSKKPKLPQASWQHCPYGRKCTYGSKCKFYHPERLHQTQLSVADELRAKTRTLPGSEEEQPRCSNVKTGPVPSLARPSLSPEGPWIPRGSTGSYRSYSNSSPGSRWREDRVPPLDRNFRGPLAESWEYSAQERLDPESAFPRNCRAGDVRFLEGQFSRLAFSDDLYGCDVPTGLRTTGIQRGVNSLDEGCNLNLPGCHGHLKSQQHGVDCACFQRESFQAGTTLTPYACRHPTVPGSCCNGPRESGPVLQKTFAPSYHPSRSYLRQSQRQTVYCPHPPAQFPIPQPTQPNEIRIREQAQKQPLGPSFWGDSSWGNCPFWRADSYLHFSEYKYPALDSVESESAFGQPFSASSPRMK